jgi:hypothetical protein
MVVPANEGINLLRLDRIDAQQIDDFKAKQRKAGLKHETINDRLTVIGKHFNVVKEWRRMTTSPRIGFLQTAEPEFDFQEMAVST